MFIGDSHRHHKIMLRQCDENRKFLGTPINVSDERIRLNNGMLFARPISSEANITVTLSGELLKKFDSWLENSSLPIVLLTLDYMDIMFTGAWVIEILSMSQVTTLFSFLDHQAKSHSDAADPYVDHTQSILMHTERNLVLIVQAECKSMMVMLILTLLTPQDRRLEVLFTFIRSMESYWISHFLLSRIMNEDSESDSHKISNASKIYGVSESHFRKLCRQAFTRGPKKQLRLWRAARSVLQLIEKDNSISSIAGNNGYASSSHFSSEIKSLFGITPREFKKLEGLLHE